VLPLPNIISTAMDNLGGVASSLYQTTRTGFLYPNTRIAFGVGIADGFEFLGQVAYWPQSLTDAISASLGLSGLTYDHFSMVVRLRKVLLQDTSVTPAISLGVGFGYSNFDFGYNLSSVGVQNVSGMNVDFTHTSISIQTSLQTAGIDFTVSKKLAIFVPYLGASAYYRWGYFEGSISNFTATLGNPVTISPSASLSTTDMGIIFVGGLGIRLGGFGLNFGGSYDPRTEQPAAEISLSVQH
jgi:hypothetical protein